MYIYRYRCISISIYVCEQCKHRDDAAPAVTITVPMSQQSIFHLSSKLNLKNESQFVQKKQRREK